MSQNSLRLLLIDDDRDEAFLTLGLLSKSREESVDTTWESSIEDGLEALREESFQVILLDLSIDGAERLDAFRTVNSAQFDVPIVVLTGCNDHSQAKEAVKLGAQDYLHKDDISTHSLVRALRYAVERHRARSQQQCLLANLREANVALQDKNERLATVVKTAQQFVDNVSHEFRTPLTVIKEYCSMTREGFGGPVTDKQSSFLGTALTRIDDLTIMVDDMLDTSRLEAGLLRVWRQETEVNDIIDNVRSTLERRAESGGIILSIRAAEDLPKMYCDGEKLSRVLINLVVNACKFTPKGGEVAVVVQLSESGEAIEWLVADTGCGMSDDEVRRVCERFRQVGDGQQMTQGFGLGLNIAKQLVELNLGELRIESELGRGSTFRFSAPVNDAQLLFRQFQQAQFDDDDRRDSICCLIADIDVQHRFDPSPVVDQFLQSAFGAGDMVYNVGPLRWLIATRRDRATITTFADEVREKWEEENRNRPAGALPPLRLTICDDVQRENLLREPMKTSITEIVEPVAASLQRSVLLVDDEVAIAEALAFRMEKAGFQVSTSDNGFDGLEIAREKQPDAIILDVRMPGMNGLETLSELKSDARTSSIPVLMLSASLIDQQLALESGARFFLSKPYDAKTILTAVETSLA